LAPAMILTDSFGPLNEKLLVLLLNLLSPQTSAVFFFSKKSAKWLPIKPVAPVIRIDILFFLGDNDHRRALNFFIAIILFQKVLQKLNNGKVNKAGIKNPSP